VSSWPYAREIQYHYVALVVPFVFFALVRALEKGAAFRHRRAALVALAGGAVAGQLFFASPWLMPRPDRSWWRGLDEDAAERRDVSALLAQVPADASVSAHYRFLPHLARRERLYMFPDLGPGLPDRVLVDFDRAGGAEKEAAAIARVLGSCSEVARTPRATVLLACPAGEGAPPSPSPGSTSPPSGRR
jgi:hypothetical protein